LQVIKVLSEAATPGAIGKAAANGSAAGSLLYSRVLPLGTGTLPARLFPLNMELSANGPRQSGSTAMIAIHFSGLFPSALTPDDLSVTLLNTGQVVPVHAGNILQADTDARSFIVSVSLPLEYRGTVRPPSFVEFLHYLLIAALS
jgi:hypothetical protein